MTQLLLITREEGKIQENEVLFHEHYSRGYQKHASYYTMQ
jgi:hypothetical protein